MKTHIKEITSGTTSAKLTLDILCSMLFPKYPDLSITHEYPSENDGYLLNARLSLGDEIVDVTLLEFSEWSNSDSTVQKNTTSIAIFPDPFALTDSEGNLIEDKVTIVASSLFPKAFHNSDLFPLTSNKNYYTYLSTKIDGLFSESIKIIFDLENDVVKITITYKREYSRREIIGQPHYLEQLSSFDTLKPIIAQALTAAYPWYVSSPEKDSGSSITLTSEVADVETLTASILMVNTPVDELDVKTCVNLPKAEIIIKFSSDPVVNKYQAGDLSFLSYCLRNVVDNLVSLPYKVEIYSQEFTAGSMGIIADIKNRFTRESYSVEAYYWGSNQQIIIRVVDNLPRDMENAEIEAHLEKFSCGSGRFSSEVSALAKVFQILMT